MTDNVLPFAAKVIEPELEEIEVRGCSNCGSTSFMLLTNGLTTCAECERTIPIVNYPWAPWMLEMIDTDTEEEPPEETEH